MGEPQHDSDLGRLERERERERHALLRTGKSGICIEAAHFLGLRGLGSLKKRKIIFNLFRFFEMFVRPIERISCPNSSDQNIISNERKQ